MNPHPYLLPFSWLYGIGVFARNKLYDWKIFSETKVSVPVISVGNITTGGTGKTPFTEIITKFFLQQKKRVAIVSRGYGRKTKNLVVVSDGEKILANVEEAGDEPFQLANNIPNAIIIVNEKRADAARYAIEKFSAEIIVMDDGFQHRALHRDLNILLITDNTFTTSVLPVGYRREMLNSVKRANAVVITKVEKNSSYEKIISTIKKYTSVPIFTSSYHLDSFVKCDDKKNISIEELQKKKCIAICAIANPEHFYETLKKVGCCIEDFFPFPDHHYYKQEELQKIISTIQQKNIEYVITTEKDAAKLLPFFSSTNISLLIAKGKITIHQQNQWEQLLLSHTL